MKRGVFVLRCRRVGFSAAEIAETLLGRRRRHDSKTIRRWEKAVWNLACAEGASIPAIAHDSAALQAVAYAKRRFTEYLIGEGAAIRYMVALADLQAGVEGFDGEERKARASALIVASPTFWEVSSRGRLLAAERDQALIDATGQPPLFPAGNPEDNGQKAADHKARAELLRLAAQVKLDPDVIRQLPRGLCARAELVGLVKEQEDEQRSERYPLRSRDRAMIRHAERERRVTGKRVPTHRTL